MVGPIQKTGYDVCMSLREHKFILQVDYLTLRTSQIGITLVLQGSMIKFSNQYSKVVLD